MSRIHTIVESALNRETTMSTTSSKQSGDKLGPKPALSKPGAENSELTAQRQADPASLSQRARQNPRLLSPGDVQRLQRAVGNQTVGGLLSAARPRALVQAKLNVGPANDTYEQEADQVADKVMRMPASPMSVSQRAGPEEEEPLQAKPLAAGITPLAQRKNEEQEDASNRAQRQAGEEEEIQETPAVQRSGGGFEAGADFESQLGAARGSGSPLPDQTRGFMEQRMGTDFSGVRVHVDSQSDHLNRSIQAKAFTTGQDVFFSQGAYQPESQDGQRLLAHELTHVVQQTGATQARRVFWGSTRSASPAQNLYAKRDPGAAQPTPSTSADIQRYSASAGFFSNKVTFELMDKAATLAKPLQIKKKPGLLKISSQDYRASGTVKASGPKGRVKEFEVGFLQTVYDSRRIFYYEPDAYNPGVMQQIGTAIAPGLLGDRVKVTDLCSPLPVRDGDAGVVPWYGTETVSAFDEADESTKTANIYDRPGTAMAWTQTANGKTQHLVKTGGQDIFRSWVSVQEKGTTGFMGMHRLAYIDWKVDYGTDITYNQADPTASIVTPTGESGGTITAISEGAGGFLPLMTDPVANDAAKEETGKW